MAKRDQQGPGNNPPALPEWLREYLATLAGQRLQPPAWWGGSPQPATLAGQPMMQPPMQYGPPAVPGSAPVSPGGGQPAITPYTQQWLERLYGGGAAPGAQPAAPAGGAIDYNAFTQALAAALYNQAQNPSSGSWQPGMTYTSPYRPGWVGYGQGPAGRANLYEQPGFSGYSGRAWWYGQGPLLGGGAAPGFTPSHIGNRSGKRAATYTGGN